MLQYIKMSTATRWKDKSPILEYVREACEENIKVQGVQGNIAVEDGGNWGLLNLKGTSSCTMSTEWDNLGEDGEGGRGKVKPTPPTL